MRRNEVGDAANQLNVFRSKVTLVDPVQSRDVGISGATQRRPIVTAILEIESIVRADRIGRDYKLWIKWKDHTHVTPRWRSELLRETTNPEILADIKRVVTEAKLRADITQGRLDDEEDVDDLGDAARADAIEISGNAADESIIVEPEVLAPDPDLPIAQRLLRRRTQGKVISVGQMSLVNAFLSDIAYSGLSAFQLSQHSNYV